MDRALPARQGKERVSRRTAFHRRRFSDKLTSRGLLPSDGDDYGSGKDARAHRGGQLDYPFAVRRVPGECRVRGAPVDGRQTRSRDGCGPETRPASRGHHDAGHRRDFAHPAHACARRRNGSKDPRHPCHRVRGQPIASASRSRRGRAIPEQARHRGATSRSDPASRSCCRQALETCSACSIRPHG